jgi:hypothetical protein
MDVVLQAARGLDLQVGQRELGRSGPLQRDGDDAIAECSFDGLHCSRQRELCGGHHT